MPGRPGPGRCGMPGRPGPKPDGPCGGPGASGPGPNTGGGPSGPGPGIGAIGTGMTGGIAGATGAGAGAAGATGATAGTAGGCAGGGAGLAGTTTAVPRLGRLLNDGRRSIAREMGSAATRKTKTISTPRATRNGRRPGSVSSAQKAASLEAVYKSAGRRLGSGRCMGAPPPNTLVNP